MLSLTQTTPPATEPVSREEAKLWSKIVGGAEDALVDELIAAARIEVETMTGFQLVTATWTLKLDGFPIGRTPLADRRASDVRPASVSEIVLPHPPLQSVTSVKYVDEAGATQTVPAGDYTVDTGTLPGRLRLAYGASWPAVRRQPGAVTIVYVAGFGLAAAVPPNAKIAVKLLVADNYDNRDRSGGTVDRERIRDLLADLWVAKA
jgi:hypothetical protein